MNINRKTPERYLDACSYFGPAVMALLVLQGAAFAQPAQQDGPLLVYTGRPLKVEDLKRAYGDAAVKQVIPKKWAVEKRLRLNVWFDFFSYDANDQGELVKMTGFLIGACDKVLPNYFQALKPIQMMTLGRDLPATVSSWGVAVLVPADPDHPMPHAGGQKVELYYNDTRPSEPCMLTHSFERKG